MINRENYKLREAYLEYSGSVRHHTPETLARDKSALRYLLEWADDTPFEKASKIKPPFTSYVERFGLSHATKVRLCNAARAFFAWLKLAYPRRFSKLGDLWIETLTPPERIDMVQDHDAYTLDEVRLLMRSEAVTLSDKRGQAAVALLFLSGMRVWAFTTMPINALDLKQRSVKQWPDLGVHTKRHKRATTYLLEIQDLLRVVGRWDRIVRASLPDTAMWFAPLTSDGMALLDRPAGSNRRQRFVDSLRSLCDLAGVRYRSPHKLRHGHALYALGKCQDIADLKAVSSNLMHANISTTDGIYGILPGKEVKQRIARLK